MTFFNQGEFERAIETWEQIQIVEPENELVKEDLEDQFSRLNILAAELAQEARDQAGKEVLIAGSLPPLRGSYRADLVGPSDEIEHLYREQANILAPHVDLFLCETMSSGIEGRRAGLLTAKRKPTVFSTVGRIYPPNAMASM